MKRNKDDNRTIIQALGMLTQLGLVVLVNIGVGLFLGYLLDKLLDTNLVFTVIGIILGIGAGFYSVYKLVITIIGDDDNVEK